LKNEKRFLGGGAVAHNDQNKYFFSGGAVDPWTYGSLEIGGWGGNMPLPPPCCTHSAKLQDELRASALRWSRTYLAAIYIYIIYYMLYISVYISYI